jgi:O-antigen/teichoic acid export membrane protein
MSAPAAADNSRTITSNSFWYAIDASVASITMLIASVPVGRIMGPQVLGHYIYLLFITGVAQRLANVGIPATACKYIAEYLGRGERGLAHEIFRITLKHQAIIAGGVTVAGCVLVGFFTEPDLRTVAWLIVVSMWPNMVNYIPAQANVAAEDLRANIPASAVSSFTYCGLVVTTLVCHWGLPGLATAVLVSRSAEALVRYWGVRRWIAKVPPRPIPLDLRRRMFSFSRQNLVLLALGLVVWDRSEVLFLKHFCDVRQVAFYSLAFSITNQLLMAPRAFSSSIGITILAQYGRDSSRLRSLMENATRYVSLLSVPIFAGIAAIADPLIRATYGPRYISVVPVLWIMSVFTISRAFQSHSESLLQATENQGFMVKWLVLSAVVNLTADWLLIPSYGAVGAAWANGIAQIFAVGGLLMRASSVVDVRPPVWFIAKVAVSSLIMAAVVVPLGRIRPLPAALIIGICVGVVSVIVMFRSTNCLEWEDRLRLSLLAGRMPARLHRIVKATIKFLIPAAVQPKQAAIGPAVETRAAGD